MDCMGSRENSSTGAAEEGADPLIHPRSPWRSLRPGTYKIFSPERLALELFKSTISMHVFLVSVDAPSIIHFSSNYVYS
jgi:hypothetical protein